MLRQALEDHEAGEAAVPHNGGGTALKTDGGLDASIPPTRPAAPVGHPPLDKEQEHARYGATLTMVSAATTTRTSTTTTNEGAPTLPLASTTTPAQQLEAHPTTTSAGMTQSYQEDFGHDTYDDDDEDDYDDEDYGWTDEEEDEPEVSISWGERAWTTIRAALLVIADVENLWDSPTSEQPTNPSHYLGTNGESQGLLSSSSQHDHHNHYTNSHRYNQRHRHWIVLFWFVVLAASYAAERSTFKLLVDRSGPFRLFAVEMVTATHALLLVIGMAISYFLQKQQHQMNLRRRSGGSGSGESWGASIQFQRQQQQQQQHKQSLPLGIPVVDVGLMAFLDVFHLMMVFLTGIYVSPILTVILVQFNLPLTAFLTQFVHPDGRCSCCRYAMQDSSLHSFTDESSRLSNGRANTSRRRQMLQQREPSFSSTSRPPLPGWGGLQLEHLWGSALIVLACLISLIPAFYSIADPSYFLYADKIPLRTAYNSLLFLAASIPAAASSLYKEHVFVHYKQPVNMDKLNLLLSVFEFIFASVLSPLIFSLQGLGSDTDGPPWYLLYPSAEFSDNFLDGLRCFFLLLDDDDQESKYPESAHCDYTMALTIFHAFSIIAVGVAVDKIVNAGATKVMYRGVSAGIILAVLCMVAYDERLVEFSYGPIVNAVNLTCLILLILGSEVYHRVSLQDSTFETEYHTIDSIYVDG